jgi:diguanylate cyclase (GGDEF)-like protein
MLTGLHAGRIVAVEAAGAIIGRDADADLVVEDTGVSRRHARVARASDGGFYVEDLGSTNGTFVGSARVGIAPLFGGETIRLGPQLRVRFAVVDATVETLYRRLYESSVRDPLTHLFNREYLAGRLVAEVAHAQRTRSDLALLIADVDSFKQVNDRFGHLVGDRALCTVGARMMRTIRLDDVLARYGGDEFVILAPAIGAIEALHLGERVCRTIQELHLSTRGQRVPITLSIGIASLAEVIGRGEHVPALLALADSRLYGAKAAGRNRVVAAGMVPTLGAR